MQSDAHTDLASQDMAAVQAQPSADSSVTRLHLRAADILERVADAFLVLDREWHILYANHEACRINQKPLENFVGRTHWEEWPASVGTEVERQYRRAMDEQVDVHFEHHYVMGAYDEWLEIDAYPSQDGLDVFYRDIGARKQTEEALRRSEERLRGTQARLEVSLAAGGIGAWDWDLVNGRVVGDANVARLFSVGPDYAAGGPPEVYLQAIHSDDRLRVERIIADAVAHGDDYEAEYRVVLPDGALRWLTARGRVERDATGRAVAIPGVVVDVTERAERERQHRFLVDLAERARVLTDPEEVIADAVRSLGEFLGVARVAFTDIDLDADLCDVRLDYCADDSVPSMRGVLPLTAFGPYIVSEFEAGHAVAVDDVRSDQAQVPPENLAAYEDYRIRAYVAAPVVHSARLVSNIACHSAVPRRWTPEETELVQAVVERTWLNVEVLRQQHALVREAETTTRILESITDAFFTLDHEYRFTHINGETERVLFKSRADLLGRYIWAVFPEGEGSMFDQQYRRAVAESVSVSFEEFYPPLDAWLEVRAYPSDDGISVFFQNVTERKKAEAERERLLAEQQARAERESLLNRIGQALRGSPDPNQFLETAVRELGTALGTDRCYYTVYDQDADTAAVAPEWHREGLPSLTGQYRMSRFAVNRDPVYKAGRTQSVADTSGDAATQALGVRALVRVPLVSGTAMTVLSVVMADGPRQWTADEVALVEAVATLTQTALEAVRVQRREHAIAQQLQDALQPAVSAHVPGLSVGHLIHPALAEAQVGGDFFDVFSLDKTLFAVVIGDVSGKGLAAAQQLALIRNSLRTTLYLSRAPAQAAATLNGIVTAHDLLVGFVTCWVGVYDAATGQMAYCSCGHEPGLVRRAGGSVEALETTGPPLGVSENAKYGELSVTLSSGDALLLYTDGLSEAGPSHRELLGTDGLARLLTALPTGVGTQAQAESLVEEVRAFAGVFRDDVAVLLTRRE